MFGIPFASKLGAALGAALDGIIYGALPKITPPSALSEAHLSPFTSVYRGNVGSTGNVSWDDVTTAANNDTTGDVSLFDTTAPSSDKICVALSAGDVVGGISLLASIAAVLTGTPVASVQYRTASGWASATAVVTPSLTSTGLKTVTFADIKYTDIVDTDDVRDPINNPQQRCIFMQFTGITAVTTAPAFTRVWKKISHATSHKATNYTAAVTQGANPDFSAMQSVILPITGDLTLMGFDSPVVRLHPKIYRPTAAALGAREWVYSKADGTFAALPAANIDDPSSKFGAALGTQSVQAVDLTSTYAAASWGNSGGVSSNTLPSGADGYLEFTVGTNAALPAFIGFSAVTTGGNGYADIRYAAHVGAGGNALIQAFYLGVLKTTASIACVAGDVVQVRKRGTTMSVWKNGELVHTFADLTDLSPLYIDTSFISNSIVRNLALFNTTTGVPVAIPITWLSNTAVTVSAPTAVLFTKPTTHQININPPADWGTAGMTDTGDVVHERYWIGWRYTGDTTAPVLPVNFTVAGQPVAGGEGIPAPETGNYTSITVACRETSPAAETVAVVNATTGKIASVIVPANTAIATAVVSLPVAKGDDIVLVHVSGSSTGVLGDGAVFLS